MTITYEYEGALYVNLTNRCNCNCEFCLRHGKKEGSIYTEDSLWLEREPTRQEALDSFLSRDVCSYREIVFCGYGEPVYRLDEMLAIASHIKRRGGKTRLNTNGHGNLIHGRDITPQLKIIDLVNISLNAPDRAMYDRLCRPIYKDVAFDSVLFFARACKASGVNCRFSVVDCIGDVCVRKCQELADREGIPLYVRKMILSEK